MSQAQDFTENASKLDNFPQLSGDPEQMQEMLDAVQSLADDDDHAPEMVEMSLSLPDRQANTVILQFSDGSVVDPHEMKAYDTVYDAKMAALGEFSDISSEEIAELDIDDPDEYEH